MRPSVRLLHTSDLHLHWQYVEAGVQSLAALRVEATREAADVVLVCGDVFDTADQPTTFIETIADALNAFDVPVLLIPGNHDIRYSDDEPDALGEVGLRLRRDHQLITDPEGECVLLRDGALHLWGRGMPEHTPTNDPLQGLASSADERAWSVALAHGELTSPHGAKRSSPIVLERHAEALSRVDYLALGHHDDASVRQFESTVVCYSGSASPILGSMEFAWVTMEAASGVQVEIRRLRRD